MKHADDRDLICFAAKCNEIRIHDVEQKVPAANI